MANYDANYNPNADPALDNAPYKGGENSEDYDADLTVTGAETSLETAAREDRDATETDSHERPSKCKFTFHSAQIGLD